MAEVKGKAWYDRLVTVDRRIIYLILAVSILLPMLFNIRPTTAISKEVRNVYEFVDALAPGDRLFLAFDYDPSTLAELHPMAEAILTQAFEKGVRVYISCLSQFGPAMADELITRIAQEHGKERNEDYVFLGYKPYPAITILAMGSDFRVPFPTDYYGTRIADIPAMQDVRNFAQMKAVISLAAGNAADFWIQYGQAKYGVKLALGVTGVMASDYYPYLQSGQIFGLLPGVKGAAEYEQLRGKQGAGSRNMPYQVAAHVVILGFMIISNIGYIAQRRAQARAGSN